MEIEHRSGEVGRGGGVADVMAMYRRLVEVMKPQSARVKARPVRKSETDCRGPIWRPRVALWPRASSQRSVTLVLSAGRSTRGSLGRTEMEDGGVVEETALSRSIVASRTA